MTKLDRVRLRKLWERALAEDGADQDITSQCAIEEGAVGTAVIVARAPGIFAGRAMFDLLKEAYATKLTVLAKLEDQASLKKGTPIATIAGPMRLLLSIERTLLNFLQRLCGVATLTHVYVQAVAGTGAKIFDTRKTIPGWRELDKYAVRCGGGHNHRVGLHDAILVKDNHLAGVETSRLAAKASELITTALTLDPPPQFVEFEVDTLEQLDQLLKVVGIDVILLDNFSLTQMRQAVARRDALGLKGKVQLEASGGVNLDTVRAIAETGVERISVGSITHSAPALDLAMEIEPARRN
ncbi:MAG TPA: carboxylating nicotinate-nucleotide diphosphorylase [Phycisphaerae bacterium]|nr:carboxylating nicotinate-nucleotide diphosphorylase [Phycisphaerae bacterium]HOJ55041.1 carboxylating nicotinate-nucleotide diphosphorylase [Phycisphaerae bacterium]HOL27782.1 carboxylating nicotinate-nucleotide diphosphorylase [Phycisphaerae bacterium]HPP21991.1 carboxylating nicotinate-nucleotide diphosphorylase [Phycisphaerae bacterium]HQA44806.1 carboxylating nicotinate-nucleotide diphosphorylase [Phycisphaerae bacterium]